MSRSPEASAAPTMSAVSSALHPRLGAVLALEDAHGVLSIYGPDGGLPRPQVRELFEASASDSPGADRRAIERRLAELERTLPTRVGTPGRAIFAGIASGRIVDIHLPVDVEPYVDAGRAAHVRPLIAAAQRARPTGLVSLSTKRLTVFEARGLLLQELDAVDLAAYEMRRRRGSRGAPSAPARQPGPTRDRHAWRRRDRLATAAAGFAEQVGWRAAARRWDLVIATGNKRLLAAFARRFPTWRTELIELDLSAEPANAAAFAASVAGEIQRIRSERVTAAVRHLAESPETIWGVGPVVGALRQGRVAELALAADLDATTAEAVIRRALATGAHVMPLAPGALGPLAIAARGRW